MLIAIVLLLTSCSRSDRSSEGIPQDKVQKLVKTIAITPSDTLKVSGLNVLLLDHNGQDR